MIDLTAGAGTAGSIVPPARTNVDGGDRLGGAAQAVQGDRAGRWDIAAPVDAEALTGEDDSTTAVPEKESLLDKLQALSPEQKALYRGLATAGEVLMARAGQLMINFIR